ncbi:2,3-dihydroxyphenylpropionate 1,2-dioxygenase [Paractinoplanes brasiliensis]|uniref:2,3-dihydroxyphenylpropionate 1,2-dioxygenase n=1 Tax=Paractinoplanes brasiliensis TaxID=52695 RepID=A0A4R6JQT3_9ACTN|nr:2,3-dihydroxyphenylpropionate 1,2-dioxygenase [Actinoplanes brasiliensis]TDO37246.1 2,3-dihydroxyphenylpropionate 1,2-dioxygenase [Actinoplanes brasiliensis]GID29441.1 2,3-dihydroxyphenylpropionate 1,2-dioxygenase [Actinoplanes brasiliensis]
MSEIVGFVGMSHSPFATLSPFQEMGERFLADAARVKAAVAALRPDAVVVIGPDHFHANFYDQMPPFVLGVERATGFGDFGSAQGELPVAGELAWTIRDGLDDAGFDVSLSYALTVDHGVVQSYEMTTGLSVPHVPLVLNTAAPPLPSPARCVALGRALGDTIRRSASEQRVLIVASGGLSHWLPSNDPRDPSVTGEKRESLIHGRKDTRAFAAAREPRVRAMAGNPEARVNAEWDRWFLRQLYSLDVSPVVELGHDKLEHEAGSGGHEIRTWLAGHAAAGRPLVWDSYEPVPEWITGMGIGTTFPV